MRPRRWRSLRGRPIWWQRRRDSCSQYTKAAGLDEIILRGKISFEKAISAQDQRSGLMPAGPPAERGGVCEEVPQRRWGGLSALMIKGARFPGAMPQADMGPRRWRSRRVSRLPVKAISAQGQRPNLMPAWGIAPGSRTNNNQGLKARPHLTARKPTRVQAMAMNAATSDSPATRPDAIGTA